MSTTFKLSAPIEHDGKTYNELVLRDPTMGDACAADKYEGQLTKVAAVLASLADVPLAVVMRVPISDITSMAQTTGIAEPAAE